jgi:hypothetical protein
MLWKHTWDALWVEECARHQAAACQRLLKECAAHNHQEANHRQQLLDKHATNECQEATHHQRLLKEEAACCQRLIGAHAAQAQWTAATTTVLLWLCRHCLKICLAWMTAWQQQREAMLACLQY